MGYKKKKKPSRYKTDRDIGTMKQYKGDPESALNLFWDIDPRKSKPKKKGGKKHGHEK